MRKLCAALLLLLIALLPARRAAAQSCSQLNWGETRSASFTFTYQSSVPLGAQLAAQYGELLDAEYARFAKLFETSLPLPISVRLYPNERDYYCFNPLAPPIPVGQFHSHNGGREIALIAQNILDRPADWQIEALDSLRYELAILFVHHLTGEKAPAGLAAGTGVLAQNPFTIFERRLQQTAPPTGEPPSTLRGLWESPDLIAAPGNLLPAASAVHYLVDVYGWADFLHFLRALRTAENWRAALNDAYPATANALEEQWASQYYALYFEGRWRSNPLYDLSLAPYEQLIAAGAYQAAADGLADTIHLLITLQDFDKLTAAQRLNARAQAGLEADSLASQARQAYLETRFEDAAGYAAAAAEKYAALGDTRNAPALAAIQTQSAEILALHAELDEIAIQTAGLGGTEHAARLKEIGERLDALGDPGGRDRAAQLLDGLNAKQKNRAALIAVFSIGIAVGLLIARLRLARIPPPPEARLQYE
jgi:hypothetical protein